MHRKGELRSTARTLYLVNTVLPYLFATSLQTLLSGSQCILCFSSALGPGGDEYSYPEESQNSENLPGGNGDVNSFSTPLVGKRALGGDPHDTRAG